MDNNSQPESFWEDLYQTEKTGWDRGGTSRNLLNWLDSKALQPCRILVPGCGNGYEVLTLAEQGFDVVAIDIAPSAVSNLHKALDNNQLKAEVIHSDFFSLDFTNHPFDAIYEQTCLCALQPKQWSEFEQWLHQSLKPEGKLYSQFMQTHQDGGPPFHCDMNEMRALFSNERWQWVSEDEPLKKHELSQKLEIPCLLQKRC